MALGHSSIGSTPIGGTIQTAVAAAVTYADAWQFDTNMRRPSMYRGYMRTDIPSAPIPAFVGQFFADAWADPADVFAYRRRRNDWIQADGDFIGEPIVAVAVFYADAWQFTPVVPKRKPGINIQTTFYEPNPATVGIFYTDAWAIPDHVYPYKKPANSWTRVNGDYEANPNTLGILYAGAWEVPSHVYPYGRRRNSWTQDDGDFIGSSIGVVVTYADAWQFDSNQSRPSMYRGYMRTEQVTAPIPAFVGQFFTGAWAEQDDVFQYRKPNTRHYLHPELFTYAPSNYVVEVTYADVWANPTPQHYRKPYNHFYTGDFIPQYIDPTAPVVIPPAPDFDGTFKGRQFGASTTATIDAAAEYGKGREFGDTTTYEAPITVTYTKGRNFD